MKKRIFLFLALTALTGSGVFAQTHFVSAEVSILGVGARYENVITPYLTANGYAYYNFLPTQSIFGIGIAGRWYPSGRRFFAELGLGYISYTDIYEKESYTYPSSGSNSETVEETFPGFSLAPGFGWTIDVGRVGGFFISPGIKVPVIITSDGVYLSVIASCGLGYAF
jgi:hypothetical protein